MLSFQLMALRASTSSAVKVNLGLGGDCFSISMLIILLQMSEYTYSNNPDEINVREIPKFEFEVNNDELKSCIKELAFNIKTSDKHLQKMKKELETKISESQITEALVFINSLIELDPSLSKQLKSRQTKKEDLATNPIANSSNELGRKINQISESVSLLHNTIKTLEKKVTELEFTSKSALTEKVNVLQEQIDDTNTKLSNEAQSLNEKIELTVAEFGDKIREVETKTLWQINDCKLRLNSCISEQYVKDSMKELEGKMITRMKEEAIKQGAIDPERIQKIEQAIVKNEKEFAASLTETNYKIKTLKDSVETSTLSKKQFGEEKIEIEKRFNHINNNIGDIMRRLRENEISTTEQKDKLGSLRNFEEATSKELMRMNEVLKNLKIGDDFQKMLEKMDPHKICELDNRVDDLTQENVKLNKYFELLKREMERVRSKTEFCNILTPNAGSADKLTREDIQEIIHDYFVNNMFAKKIQTLESQLLEVKAFPEMVNELNKKVARMQKEGDNHNLMYELRGLQEYVKKENLIMNNRINQLEAMIAEQKKRRPSSAGKNLGESRLGSSISYKKLTPVNCISCYTTDRKSIIKRL